MADQIVLDRLQRKAEGWEWVARQFEELAARRFPRFVEAWLRDAHVGFTGYFGGEYTVTERRTGLAVVVFEDGRTKTLQAPGPLA